MTKCPPGLLEVQSIAEGHLHNDARNAECKHPDALHLLCSVLGPPSPTSYQVTSYQARGLVWF